MEAVKKTMGENFTKASELYNFAEKRIPFQECVQMIGKLARGGVNLNGRGFQVWMRAVNRQISGVMNGSVDVCGEDTLDALRKMEVRHERQNELRIAELVTDFQEGIDKMNGEKDGWKSRIDALFAERETADSRSRQAWVDNRLVEDVRRRRYEEEKANHGNEELAKAVSNREAEYLFSLIKQERVEWKRKRDRELWMKRKKRTNDAAQTVEKEDPIVRPEKKPVEFAERMADLQVWMQAALSYMLYEQDTDEKMDFVTRMVRKTLREIREIMGTVSPMGAA